MESVRPQRYVIYHAPAAPLAHSRSLYLRFAGALKDWR